jgi:hypothetical protein
MHLTVFFSAFGISPAGFFSSAEEYVAENIPAATIAAAAPNICLRFISILLPSAVSATGHVLRPSCRS